MKIKASYLTPLFVFTATIVAPQAWAGRDVGNGGDAVLCKNKSGRVVKWHSLDRLEGQMLKGRDIVLDPKVPKDPFLQATAVVMGAVDILTAERAERYKDQIGTFVKEANSFRAWSCAIFPIRSNLSSQRIVLLSSW